MLLFLLAGQTPSIEIADRFGRDVSSQGVVLTDWDGHLANPAIELSITVRGGTSGMTGYVHGTDSRIYFDRSSPDDRSGIGRRMDLQPGVASKFLSSIFPDRDGKDETHQLVVQVFNGAREVARKLVKVVVEDHDKAVGSAPYPIHLDFGQDRTDWTRSAQVRDTLTRAAKDWEYFLEGIGQEQVPAGSETTPIWNPDGFITQRKVSNARPYSGYLMYAYGIHHDEMRAGGAPSLLGKPQTANGKATGLGRSGSVEFDYAGNWNRMGWLLDHGDNAWWYSGNLRSEQSDLYSIAVHEMGHALAFHPHYPVYATAKQAQWPASRLTRYLGFSPKIDASDHLVAVIDPVSQFGGFGMEYQARMKARRWLITKSHLFCLEAIGYKLKPNAAFEDLSVPPKVDLRKGQSMSLRIPAVGGVPPYRFSSGSLPPGLTLDGWTGLLSGKANVGRFKVQVEDQDASTPPCEVEVTIS